MGGIHPTAVPEEAQRFADAVVVGEAEDAWPELLKDFAKGEMKPIYRPVWPDLGNRPFPRRDLFTSKKYIPFQVVQTMRGCPYPCEFCSVSTANGSTMRFRPSDEVLGELRTLGKLIMFADDNVMIHRGSTRRTFFTRMIPLQKLLDRSVLARRGEADREHQADGRERLQGAVHRVREHRRVHGSIHGQAPEQARSVQRGDGDAPRARHQHVGQLRLRLRHRRQRGLRSNGGVRPRDAAHDGALRHPHALPRDQPLQAPPRRGPAHRSQVVAPQGSRRRLAVLRADADEPRGAPRGLGQGVDELLFAALDLGSIHRPQGVELDSDRRLLPAQHHAKPARAPEDRRRAAALPLRGRDRGRRAHARPVATPIGQRPTTNGSSRRSLPLVG